MRLPGRRIRSTPPTEAEVLAAFERISKALEEELAKNPAFKAEVEEGLQEEPDTTMGYDTLEEKRMDREP